jgi:uncharacterized RDD family membrane protein YckC
MTYYAAIDGKQEGPFTEEELRQKIGTTVTLQTPVWKEGMQDWLPLELVMPALALTPAGSVFNWEPASRLIRLGAILIDGIPFFLILILCAFASALAGGNKDEVSPAIIFICIGAVVLILAVAVLQIVMLARYSQSIGKWMLKIRIYDIETRLPANWVKTIVLRMFVNSLATGIPFIGGIYGLVDILFIFREDRRCVHDLIAGTVVGTVPPTEGKV